MDIDYVESHAVPSPVRTSILGFLTISDDIFDVDAAVQRGLALSADGADIVEVSDRPSRQNHRFQSDFLEVVQDLVAAGTAVSVNTTNADLAVLAADRGASYIHDISGGVVDIFMPRIAAESGLTFISGCWEQSNTPVQSRVVNRHARLDVAGLLDQRVDALLMAGLAPENLVLDWDFELSEQLEQDWQIMRDFDRLIGLSYPLLIDASHQNFLKSLVHQGASEEEEDAAALAVSVLATESGAWGVRVRNVARTHRALRGFPSNDDDSWLNAGHSFESRTPEAIAS